MAADVALAARASAQGLALRRQRRLIELLRTAAERSPLYRRLLAGRAPERWSLADLPAVRKPDLMASFDDWVCDPQLKLAALEDFIARRETLAEPFLGRYVVWESSGSSGEPGIFVQDDAAMAVYDALEAMRRPVLHPGRRLLDPWYWRERIAFIGAVDGHFASTVTVERLRRLNPSLSERLRGLSFLQPMSRMVAELQDFNPTIITTYPSQAQALAQEQRAGRLRLQLQEIWTGGEGMTQGVRREVQEAFGCPVVNSYGASEFLPLAAECEFAQLHLNSDWVILEPVDEQGRALPAGLAGATTLLTNLANRVQPLIRYDLGDQVAVHTGRCECGSPLPVIEVQGRCDDILHLGATASSAVAVLPLAVSTVLEHDAGLYDFQLVQQGPGELLLRTPARGEAAAQHLRRARDVLAGFLLRKGAGEVHIHCRSGEPMARARSGKVQRIVAWHPDGAPHRHAEAALT